MPNYKVKDIKLAKQGKKLVERAEEEMPVLEMLRDEFKNDKFLKGYKIAGAIHVTKETAVLTKTLKYLGADVAWAGCNPLSTNDSIAAAMAEEGIKIYAWRSLNSKDYYWCIDQIIKTKPHLTLDDGCDVVVRIHNNYPEKLEDIIGGTEETTTGVHRLQSMHEAGVLAYPIMAVNNAETKWDFDNIYGTGQGTIDGIQRATATLITGKTFIVAGYGHCGKGVARRARGLDARVIVTEVDPLQGLKAKMDGYEVMPMMEAAKLGDIFVTATGVRDIITEKHFKKLKDGVILSNTGHFNVEVDYDYLENNCSTKDEIRPNMVKYEMPWGKKIYLLAEGRLVNLSAAEGHPSEVMDLSFANQILCLKNLLDNKDTMDVGVYDVPKKQDNKIATMKLKGMGIKLDKLTKEQIAYMNSYDEGT
ncbi:MAG: adenosylhomocysteinase [Nanoarchaeota archaeon]|nr:adenosylhomocysteinase [Nanoarchaeota archaeon]MCG2718435.1 adenosylhomocysteinase [Nanoarchaeota archaeon]